ncbi:MAG TPA: 2-hydroxyacyl-CoA dehydratase [Clostridiales bacterium]|nr:2-hydroxyacyl-CoA dehydratase [Clostridiales bacterium]
MGIRSCAENSLAFRELKWAFDNKRKAISKMMDSGKKTVWMMGDDVPEEVILAAGMLPVRLCGYYGPRPNADKYLEISFGAYWRGLFEAIMNDEYKGMMDFLVLSNSSDIIQKLYYYLLELKRMEPERRLPVIEYVDYSLFTKDFRSQEHNVSETKEFIAKVEGWCGSKISDGDLADAIKVLNEYKKALRAFSALRYGKDSRVTGSEAITAIVGSFYFDKAKATELIKNLTKEAESWPKVEAVRVLYTGSMQETAEVYELMEAAGLNVVTEDKLFGDRYADRDTDPTIPPARAIASRYINRFPSSERAFIKERAGFIPERIKEVGAEGMVIFMNHNDESYIWDFPKQRDVLKKMGIQTLMIEDQYYPLKDKEELSRRFASFARTVKGGQI